MSNVIKVIEGFFFPRNFKKILILSPITMTCLSNTSYKEIEADASNFLPKSFSPPFVLM